MAAFVHDVVTVDSKRLLEQGASYQIDGKMFLVESVFQSDGRESLATILLRLITSDRHDST